MRAVTLPPSAGTAEPRRLRGEPWPWGDTGTEMVRVRGSGTPGSGVVTLTGHSAIPHTAAGCRSAGQEWRPRRHSAAGPTPPGVARVIKVYSANSAGTQSGTGHLSATVIVGAQISSAKAESAFSRRQPCTLRSSMVRCNSCGHQPPRPSRSLNRAFRGSECRLGPRGRVLRLSSGRACHRLASRDQTRASPCASMAPARQFQKWPRHTARTPHRKWPLRWQRPGLPLGGQAAGIAAK